MGSGVSREIQNWKRNQEPHPHVLTCVVSATSRVDRFQDESLTDIVGWTAPLRFIASAHDFELCLKACVPRALPAANGQYRLRCN